MYNVIFFSIHVLQPKGFVQGDLSLICKLNKSLYELRKASRTWFHKFISSLYLRSFIYLLVYVNDIIITRRDSFEVSHIIFTQVLCLKGSWRSQLLSWYVDHNPNKGLLLRQTKYTFFIRLTCLKPNPNLHQ